MTQIATNSISVKKNKYGITESKKAQLDSLAKKVQDAQFTVQQNQAIVTSLTDKWNSFTAMLAMADAKKARALDNRNQVDHVVQSALDLQHNSDAALNELAQADVKTQLLAPAIRDVMNKLIYSAEVINKMAATIIRKKALNPLISDDLVAQVGVAGTDANNAVALTLIALQATFAAQASNIESEAAMALEYKQAQDLYSCLTEIQIAADDKLKPLVSADSNISLRSLLKDAYVKAQDNYARTQKALDIITRQLNDATSLLNKSQVKLGSLQAAYAAANAAAMAS